MELQPFVCLFVCFPIAGKPDMTYLAISGLVNKVKGSWVEIAGLLGQTDEVPALTHKHMADASRCCSDVFKAWIDNAGTEACPVSWKGLRDVLCHDNVKHCAIADDLGI
jgi:hypothetical protein